MHGHLWVWGLACGMRFHRRWRAGGRQPLWCFAMTVSRCRSTSGSSDVHFLLIPGGSDSKESACSAGNLGSIPGWGRSPREGNSDPLQYSCLENPMDRGAWVGYCSVGFLGGSDSKESACSAGNLGLIPGSGRSPGEGNGNPLQYSCLENPMDRGTWLAIIHGITAGHN